MENKTVLGKKYGTLIMFVVAMWHSLGYFAVSESLFGLGRTFINVVFKDGGEYEMLWLLFGGFMEVCLILLPAVLLLVLFILTLAYHLIKNKARKVIGILFMILNSIICIASSSIFIFIFSSTASGTSIVGNDSDFAVKIMTAVFFNPLIELILLAAVIIVLVLTFTKNRTQNYKRY